MPVINPMSAALLQQMSVAGLSPAPSSGILDTVRAVLEAILQKRALEQQNLRTLLEFLNMAGDEVDKAQLLSVIGPRIMGKQTWMKYYSPLEKAYALPQIYETAILSGEEKSSPTEAAKPTTATDEVISAIGYPGMMSPLVEALLEPVWAYPYMAAGIVPPTGRSALLSQIFPYVLF